MKASWVSLSSLVATSAPFKKRLRALFFSVARSGPATEPWRATIRAFWNSCLIKGM